MMGTCTRSKVIDKVIAKHFEPCCENQRRILREAMADVFDAGMDAGKEGAE